MKKRFAFFMICLLLAINLYGCGMSRNDKKDLQRLSQVDIYSNDGTLLHTIRDEDTLYQLDSLFSTDSTSNSGIQQDELHKMTDNFDVLYTLVFSKTPAALFHDGTLEKIREITIYRDSNIVKEQLAPELIKGIHLAEEDLAFYIEASNEDIEFVLSLVNSHARLYRAP